MHPFVTKSASLCNIPCKFDWAIVTLLNNTSDNEWQRQRPSKLFRKTNVWSKVFGAAGYRSPYLSHAKRALYHLSYSPWWPRARILWKICYALFSVTPETTCCIWWLLTHTNILFLPVNVLTWINAVFLFLFFFFNRKQMKSNLEVMNEKSCYIIQ